MGQREVKKKGCPTACDWKGGEKRGVGREGGSIAEKLCYFDTQKKPSTRERGKVKERSYEGVMSLDLKNGQAGGSKGKKGAHSVNRREIGERADDCCGGEL